MFSNRVTDAVDFPRTTIRPPQWPRLRLSFAWKCQCGEIFQGQFGDGRAAGEQGISTSCMFTCGVDRWTRCPMLKNCNAIIAVSCYWPCVELQEPWWALLYSRILGTKGHIFISLNSAALIRQGSGAHEPQLWRQSFDWRKIRTSMAAKIERSPRDICTWLGISDFTPDSARISSFFAP